MRALFNADAVYLSTDIALSKCGDFSFFNAMLPECTHIKVCLQYTAASITSHKCSNSPSFKNSCSLIKADELVGQGGEAR